MLNISCEHRFQSYSIETLSERKNKTKKKNSRCSCKDEKGSSYTTNDVRCPLQQYIQSQTRYL